MIQPGSNLFCTWDKTAISAFASINSAGPQTLMGRGQELLYVTDAAVNCFRSFNCISVRQIKSYLSIISLSPHQIIWFKARVCTGLMDLSHHLQILHLPIQGFDLEIYQMMVLPRINWSESALVEANILARILQRSISRIWKFSERSKYIFLGMFLDYVRILHGHI